MTQAVYITGSGSFLPGNPIPFANIDAVLGIPEGTPSDILRWMKRTGDTLAELLDVKCFHYAIDPDTGAFTEDNVSMAVKAARIAIASAGLKPTDIDLICYGSPHQDQMPTASVRIQEALGIERCEELSIHANCTSAYKAMYLAHRLIQGGHNRHALVLSSNLASSELRGSYYNPAHLDKESLFLRWFLCDGAGALVLSANQNQHHNALELEETFIESIGGNRAPHMFNKRPALWMNPKEEYDQGLHHLRQCFRNSLATDVFQEGDGSIFINGFKRMAIRMSLDPATLRYFQINLPAKHIMESVMDECAAIGIPPTAIYTKLHELGYAGPPMVFICLDKIMREEPLMPGDRIASFVTEVSKFMQAGYVAKKVLPIT